MKTAIYIRVSTEEQVKEGYSISAQKQKLKAFCIAQDWDAIGLYVDEGISAKDMNRPQLQAMIKDIEAGKIECVLVYRLDRLTRSVLDLYKLLEILDHNDCKFKSATEVYDTTTAMGRMFITIVAALAQWERENMGERISMGFAEKVRQGKYALNFRPYGYDLDLKTGLLSINESESKIVRLIYDLYFKGYGANKICKHLNAKGITTANGNKWNDKPLMQLIKNPLYKGFVRWKDSVIESSHTPIIPVEEWEHAQEIILKNRSTEPRRVASDYIFSGKLKCNTCGSGMVGYQTFSINKAGEKVKYLQYRCLRKRTGECFGSRSVSERLMEKAFIDYLITQDFSEQLEQAAATGEVILNEINEPSIKGIDSFEKELEKIARRKKKWQYAWSDDMMTDEDFRQRMEEANKEEESIREQLLSINNQLDEVNILPYNRQEIAEALSNIKLNWYSLDQKVKKQLIDSIIEQIHYDVVKVKQRNLVTLVSIDFY